MLMHLSVSDSRKKTIVNRRRPNSLETTYPTPPIVGRFLANHILQNRLTKVIQFGTVTVAGANEIAQEHLQFRVLDPSMESGELA